VASAFRRKFNPAFRRKAGPRGFRLLGGSSALRRVLLEDLLTHPLRRRPGAAADPKVLRTSPTLDLDAPLTRSRVGRDRHGRTDDPEFPQCGLRNSLDVGLIHTTPMDPR